MGIPVAAADAACDAAAVAGPCRGNVARYGTCIILHVDQRHTHYSSQFSWG